MVAQLLRSRDVHARVISPAGKPVGGCPSWVPFRVDMSPVALRLLSSGSSDDGPWLSPKVEDGADDATRWPDVDQGPTSVPRASSVGSRSSPDSRLQCSARVVVLVVSLIVFMTVGVLRRESMGVHRIPAVSEHSSAARAEDTDVVLQRRRRRPAYVDELSAARSSIGVASPAHGSPANTAARGKVAVPADIGPYATGQSTIQSAVGGSSADAIGFDRKSTVCLLTIMTQERLASLHRMLNAWDGYVSVAMLVDSYDEALGLGLSILHYRGQPPVAPERLTLTLVEDRGYRQPHNRFPYNVLRNAALRGCTAECVIARAGAEDLAWRRSDTARLRRSP